MKIVGTVLIIAGVIAVLVPRLHVSLPEGVSLPTLPTDILGGLVCTVNPIRIDDVMESPKLAE